MCGEGCFRRGHVGSNPTRESHKVLLQSTVVAPDMMQVDRDGTVMFGEDSDSTSSDDDQGDTQMQQEDQSPDAVPMTTQHQQDDQAVRVQQPVIDEDGFQTVQKPSRRRAMQTH